MGQQEAGQLDDDTIEHLARAYHERYRRSLPDDDRAGPADRPWDDLPEHLREANRASARAAVGHLEAIGLRVRPAPPGRAPAIARIDPDLVDVAARREHLRWAEHTRGLGYVHGPDRDDDANPPHHPDLVTWDRLDEPTRDKDRVRIRELPALLAEVGFEVHEADA